MSQLVIYGRVIHPNGIPCKFAEVVITDLDVGGNGDDVIWNGTTDEYGEFSGLTVKGWKDVNVLPGPPGSLVQTPDILNLQAQVRQENNVATLPYFKLDVVPPNFSKVAPYGSLAVPWAAPAVGKVLETYYATPHDLHNAVVDAAVVGGVSSINLQIYGPGANAFSSLSQPPDQLKQWVIQRLKFGANMRMFTYPETDPPAIERFWTQMAIVAIITARRVTNLNLLAGTAISYAVSRGYRRVGVLRSDTFGIHLDLVR